ncbi:hypothetical protein JR316_0001921 [Psilocybe cubensis]|uniref:Uncharacterized protein n=2 Tax=Psilocybe cubensis TaxID=181762 RepID=A0A8H8CNZ2_PSICU|nr:hypothetical protein JR316_0001921 [Psilocybe cubensis]KAH9485017.1 hypothetical protein JR316_0001921 [Psilocybe cubensis]
MIRSIAFAALVSYVSAQSIPSISSGCQSAITGVAANPDAAACLSPGSLVALAATSSSSSIIDPINQWLTSLCAAPACSSATISAVVQNVTTGCASDLAPLGFSASLTPSITGIIQQYYPTVRKVVCLKDGNTNCITQTLTNVEKASGSPITLENITTIAATANLTDPAITCTNCIKAAYNVIKTDLPSLVSDADADLNQQCGASFTDGQTPAGILQSANSATATPGSQNSNNNSGALGFASSRGALAGLGASAAIIISSFFAILA